MAMEVAIETNEANSKCQHPLATLDGDVNDFQIIINQTRN
jgi:hypothetical protein